MPESHEPDDGLVREADRMSPAAHRVAIAAFSLFVLVCIGTPIVDAYAASGRAKLDGAEKVADDKKRAAAAWLDGTRFALIASDLKEGSSVRKWALPVWAWGLWRGFGEVAGTLVSGSDGWIYMRERIKTNPLPDDRLVGLAAASVAVADRRLAGMGIDPIVVLVPRKEAVARAHVPKHFDARPDLDARVIAAARGHGVRVPDVDGAFAAVPADDVYHKTDSHWNDRGTLAAAVATAVALGAADASAKAATLPREPVHYTLGDALRMSAVTRTDRTNPLGAGEPDIRVRTPDAPDLAWEEKTPKPMTDTALLGTSFSAHSRFRADLEWLLGEKVWSGARPGMGPMIPVEDLLRRVPGGRFPKRLVWEVPLHYLVSMSTPLDRLANLVDVSEAPNVVAVAGLDRVGDVFSTKSSMKRGDARPSDGELILSFANGRLHHPGGGVFSFRIRGLPDDDVQVMTVAESSRIIAPWRKGRTEITVPLMAWKPTFEGSVHLRSQKPVKVRIDAVELVSDCDIEGGATPTKGAPWKPGRLDHVVVDVDMKGRRAKTVTIDARLDDGTAVRLAEIGDVGERARLVVSARAVVGRNVVGLVAKAADGASAGSPRSAPWRAAAPESRSTR